METRLLIVGRENLFRLRLAERLKLENFHVYLAETDCRPDIKKIIKKNKIDVAVVDLSELKREGISILESIQKSRAKVEVLLINSSDQISLSIAGMKLGAHNDYLLPLDMEEFVAGVREAADAKRRRDKKSFIRKYQDTMAAVAFAEAGEPETAKLLLGQSKEDSELGKKIKQSRKCQT